jgi:hypothetical protein
LNVSSSQCSCPRWKELASSTLFGKDAELLIRSWEIAEFDKSFKVSSVVVLLVASEEFNGCDFGIGRALVSDRLKELKLLLRCENRELTGSLKTGGG